MFVLCVVKYTHNTVIINVIVWRIIFIFLLYQNQNYLFVLNVYNGWSYFNLHCAMKRIKTIIYIFTFDKDKYLSSSRTKYHNINDFYIISWKFNCIGDLPPTIKLMLLLLWERDDDDIVDGAVALQSSSNNYN